MCRLLGYLGRLTKIDALINEPEHSLMVQSYQPREMTSGLVNADGFGIAWYEALETEAFVYKNILPIWNDINLQDLGRYIKSECVIANVRSATSGQSIDLSNCHPFKEKNIVFTHNGCIENFRQTLYKPIRSCLEEEIYLNIKGNTDSEHIFALFLNEWQAGKRTMVEALQKTLTILKELSDTYEVALSANLIVSDGKEILASRFACRTQNPSLYWIKDDSHFPDAVLIASEPLFTGSWHTCAENSILLVDSQKNVTDHRVS